VSTEFLKQIQAAERKADEIIKGAEAKAKAHIEEAEEEARKLLREEAARRKPRLADAREKGRAAAEAAIEEMKRANAEECAKLDEMAAKRLKDALSAIEKKTVG